MEVVLLGTGSADGWPNPFCSCASCNDARECGQIRGQTAALVDGALLIDCGPEIPRAAARLGHRLDSVTTLLFTHAHPDHVGPAALLFRHWAKERRQLRVVGPPAVLELCAPWVAPDDPASFVPIAAGDTVAVEGFTLRALAANHHGPDIGPAVLYDIEDHKGERLLYACDTGLLPPATLNQLADRSFDIALVEETFGDLRSHDGSHLDLATFAETVATLRRCGALTERSEVVAVHLSHHNPPTSRLRQLLSGWDVRLLPDGAVLKPATGRRTRPSPARTLVLGGARSGKSRHAESLLAAEDSVTYVATSDLRPDDREWQQRVDHHRAQRPQRWTTRETTDLAGVLLEAKGTDILLIDCLTVWLARVIDDTDGWHGDIDAAAKRVDELVHAWRHTRARVVAVSNEVGWGVVPATASGRMFRDLHGRMNAAVAAASDRVTLVVAGRPMVIGGPPEPADLATDHPAEEQSP